MNNIKARDIVRASVSAAVERRHKKRSDAAKQAAETRRLRTADRVYAIAKRLVSDDGAPIGPRDKCVICCRGLSDQQSIDRGIGSECWRDVLAAIAAQAVRP